MSIPIFPMLTIGLLPSRIKIWYYRMKGAKIGSNVYLGLFSFLDGESIILEDHCSIGMLSIVRARKIRLGKRSKVKMMTFIDTGELWIDNDTIIMEQVIIGGMQTPRSKITIGKRVKIMPHSFLNPTEPITIHDDVGIGGSSCLFTHGTWQNVLDGFPATFGPITIEKGARLSWRVFVPPNIRIGEYSIIGADCMVNKNIPPLSVASGNPAQIRITEGKYIRKRSNKDKNRYLIRILDEFVQYLNYQNIKSDIIHSSECHLQINMGYRNKIFSLHYDMTFDSTVAADYYIFLDGTNVNHHFLSQRNQSWFDIGSKKSIYKYNDKLWIMLKDYFSRYGIRFEYLN